MTGPVTAIAASWRMPRTHTQALHEHNQSMGSDNERETRWTTVEAEQISLGKIGSSVDERAPSCERLPKTEGTAPTITRPVFTENRAVWSERRGETQCCLCGSPATPDAKTAFNSPRARPTGIAIAARP